MNLPDISKDYDGIASTILEAKRRFMKPHLHKRYGRWECEARGLVGLGKTPKEAFQLWSRKVNRDLMQRFA